MNTLVVENLERPTPEDIATLLTVWESAVRGTHAFLHEDDITALRPQVQEYLEQVALRIVRDDAGRVAGFTGISGDMLEMLFVRAEARGRGMGGMLLRQAVAEGVTRLDVNEQNPEAVSFYQHMGFSVAGRSPLDGQGRPFPLLHMRLETLASALGATPCSRG